MRHGKKWMALSAALLASCALTSCTMPRTISTMLGDERTMPEGTEANFGAPHRPILNPMNIYSAMSESDAQPTPAPRKKHSQRMASAKPAKSGMRQVASNGRRIPSENIAILNGQTAPDSMMASAQMAAPTTTVETALNDALTNKPASNVAPLKLTKPSAEPMPTMAMEQQQPVAETVAAQPADMQPVTMPVAEAMKEQAPAPVVQMASTETPSASLPAQPAMDAETRATLEEWKAPVETAPSAASAMTQPAPSAEVVKLTPPSAPKPADMPDEATAPVAVEPPMANNAPATTETPVAAAAPAAVETPVAAVTPAEPAPAAEAAAVPMLASVPDAPERTPSSQIASDVSSLTQDRETSKTASQDLMNNSNATAMTSPDTGKLVDNAATAQPTETKETVKDQAVSDKGFSGWLHHVFSADNDKQPATETQAITEQASASSTEPLDIVSMPAGLTAEEKQALTASAPKDEAAPASNQELAMNNQSASSLPNMAPAAGQTQSKAETPAAPAADMAAPAPDMAAAPAAMPETAPATPAADMAAAPAAAAPEATSAAPAAPAAAEPVANATPAPTDTMPAKTDAAAAAAAPSAGTLAAPTEVVQLKPPATSPDAPAKPAETSAAAEPAQDTQTNAPAPVKEEVHYLPESRYATKRKLAPVNESY